jgi:hypothetical protein
MSNPTKKITKHIPGFRQGKYLNQYIALVAYISMAIVLISAFQQSVLWGGISLAVFLFSLAFIFDIGELWQVLRLPKHDRLLAIFILLVYLSIVSTILYIFSPNSVKLPERNQLQTYPQSQDFTAP